MQCSEFEIRLCEYLDGTLDAESRRQVEQHASGCRLCAEQLADARAVREFLDGVPEVESPPSLTERILYNTQSAQRPEPGEAGWRRWLRPLLQPRFVMGMAMTILSFSMLSRVAGVKVRQLEAADLNPVAIWHGVENQAHRIWDRSVKFYQNVRFIYEIMSQLRGSDEEQDVLSPPETDNRSDPESRRRIEPAPRPDRKN